MARTSAAGRGYIRDDPLLDLNRFEDTDTNPFSLRVTEVTSIHADTWTVSPTHPSSGLDHDAGGNLNPTGGDEVSATAMTPEFGQNLFSWHASDTGAIVVDFDADATGGTQNPTAAATSDGGHDDGHSHPDETPLAIGEETPEGATPTSGGTVSLYDYSGENNIDSLLSVYKWDGGLGTGANLTFSFGTASSVYISGYTEATNGFAEFTAHQKQQTRAALDFWSNVADITFTEVTDSATVAGDLRFAHSDSPSTAWAYLPSGTTRGGDVWVSNNSWYDDMSFGTYGFSTIMHEIGHAVGLSHPHSGGVVADVSIDFTGNSIMSYRSYIGASTSGGYTQNYYPDTTMINDIATMQYLYGANNTYNASDTVYAWSANEQLLETIWDAGGTDTIDWSNQTTAAVIRLTAGEWSELGPTYKPKFSLTVSSTSST